MSRLQELIDELCPNGVEYKKISAYSRVLRGKRLTKDKLSDDNIIPVYHGGIEPLGFYHESNRPANMVMVINVGASAGTVAFSEKEFWSSDGCFCIDKADCMNDRYLYHYLKNNEHYFMSRVRRAGIPTLDNFVVEEFKVPVPPLEVQCEIVRVLDSFTLLTDELIDELTDELVSRKKQYEYYKESLLKDNHKYEKVKLKDIVSIHMCRRILKSETLSFGEIPFYQNGTLGEVAKLFLDRETYNAYLKKSKMPKVGEVMLSTAGTVGKTVVYDGEAAYYQDSNIVWLSNDEEKVTNEYLYWFCKSFPWNIPDRVTLKHLHNYMIEDTDISIPPIEEQKKVINAFKKLYSSINDMTEQLLREIDVRQKQYEYYRDKLLSFKEMV